MKERKRGLDAAAAVQMVPSPVRIRKRNHHLCEVLTWRHLVKGQVESGSKFLRS